MALEVRDATGRGQYIDHAQLETSVHFLAPGLLDLQVNDHMATRRGNHEDYAAPNNAYRCGGDRGPLGDREQGTGDRSEDRWVAITVASDEEWQALCGMLGHPEAAEDARFVDLATRKANEEELDELIQGWVIGEEAFALAERLQAAGVAAGVVARAEDLFADPQLQHRRFFTRLEHPEIGDHAVHTQSFRIEGVAAGPFRAAPLLGEHTHDILHDVLEMSDDEIAELVIKGVLQ